MQQNERLADLGPEEQKRVDRIVETLTILGNHGENVAEVAHDARNMMTALDLYCDLLQEPGVLAKPFTHYCGELRLVAAASRRLVDKLTALRPSESSHLSTLVDADDINATETRDQRPQNTQHWKNLPPHAIRNLAEEVLANRNLLGALAGPTVALTVDVQGGALPVRLAAEDLTRILVNLVKNASEAMSAVGRIHISLWESSGDPLNSPWVTLNIEDNGPGLPEKILANIFERRPASRHEDPIAADSWPVAHRGLGLSITRSIVEAAGGLIHAANRDPAGACFQIELPVCPS
jgi:signal transduction histidine kinase